MYICKILRKVIEGLRNCCLDGFSMTGKINYKIKPEYYITSNIVSSILKLNTSFGEPYIIKMEEPTKEFARNCVPLFGSENFIKMIISRFHNTTRNGKVDIAIYKENSQSSILDSFCCIEVKGFDPTNNKISEDLKRNYELLKIKDETGNNSLICTIFTCLFSDSTTREFNNKEEKLKKIRKRILKILDKYKDVYADLKIFTLLENLVKEDEISQYRSDDEYWENRIEEIYHIIGCIIIFSRK